MNASFRYSLGQHSTGVVFFVSSFITFEQTHFLSCTNVVFLPLTPHPDTSIPFERFPDRAQLVLKNSDPPQQVLNGRAALCAGRDDMSSDDEQPPVAAKATATAEQRHRFAKPDNFKTVLESGAIPDAAMIHAARKRRQQARDEGDFIPVEEKPPAAAAKGGKSRLVREDGDDDDGSDEERVDMSAINGSREREERREQFYAVQQECEY